MSVLNNLNKRLDINNDSDNYQYFEEKYTGLTNMQKRLNVRGGTDQWTRMREDKLRGLKKALLSSYQSAVVQKYDVENDTLINNIISIMVLLQENQELSSSEEAILDSLEQEYTFLSSDRTSPTYLYDLQNIVNELSIKQPLFRCLINHDKLKVDYEDKIISIPFFEPPIGSMDPVQTNFHNGTVFKWVHGNKEEWTPDTYWIVYMQYSEETAYFRAEIRKADEEVEIIVIDEEGNEKTSTYRGWMTGPNETTALWNVKKGVVWNDLNYTKILYITKDENTLAFFQRFDRLIINGKPWEVQAYNESYTSTAGTNSGVIRVALKEAYTSTDQFVKQTLEDLAATEQKKDQYDATHTNARIDGLTIVEPYSIVTYEAKNFEERDSNDNIIQRQWSISDTTKAKIMKVSEDTKTATIQILVGRQDKKGFDINYGTDDNTKINVVIRSL